MFNFAEIIAAVVVTAINVVNTIVQTATGGQGNLAETFQSFTDTMNAAVGGGGDDRDNDQSDQDQTIWTFGGRTATLRTGTPGKYVR